MTDSVLLELSKYGLGVLILVYGIRWLAMKYEILMAKNEVTVQGMMNRCDQERTALTARIQMIEDRQFTSQFELLQATVRALEMNAHAFEKLSDIETDIHRAIEPKKKI